MCRQGHFRLTCLALFALSCLACPAAAVTVVVAPLHDASPDGDADTVQGVTDLMAGVLAEKAVVVDRQKLREVLAEHRLSVAALSDARTAARVGKLLEADYLLAGSVFRTKGEIKFAVQLLRIPSGEVVKGITVSGPPSEILKTGTDLAAQCAEALKIPVRKPPVEGTAVTHLAGERYFLEALGYYHAGNYDRAIMNCLKVIQLDPNNEKARLRLAESFLAAGDTGQSRITLHRTLQLFPRLELTPRIEGLLGRLDPEPIQAIEREKTTFALPADWPKDTKVSYELNWIGQPARRDTTDADDGRLVLEMPGARVPLDLKLVMSADGQRQVTRAIRLWPADAGIRAPEKDLVVVDPDRQFVGLLRDIKHKHYMSVKSIPEPDVRLVITPSAAEKITKRQAARLADFVARGGQLRLVGRCGPEVELAGVRSSEVHWPAAKDWSSKSGVAAWSFMPAKDFVAAFSRMPKAALLRGGTPWLSSGNGEVALISEAAHGKGHLLWIAWQAPWNPTDPRCARVVALAISDAASRRP